MKTSAIVVVAAAAALTNAQTPPLGDNKVNCAKPNATYCMGGDIILRCDGNALGTAGRCSANVSGYPPSGGTAECWESDRLAGDAACKKNCVVYAAQSSYTLPGDQCTPTAQPTSAQPSPPPPSETIYTIPEGTSPPSSVPTTPGNPETTIIYSIPEGSIPPPNPTTLTTAPGTSSPPAQTTESGIMSIPESSLPPPNTEAPSSTANPSTTPSAPPTPVPTNGASTKSAAGALAALGLVVALFM